MKDFENFEFGVFSGSVIIVVSFVAVWIIVKLIYSINYLIYNSKSSQERRFQEVLKINQDISIKQ